MSNQGILTGDLSNDSPQLAGTLKRTFSKEICESLASVYKQIWALGGCSEPTPRREGVSYNPRPARIACLLLQDAQCIESSIIEEALRSCVPYAAAPSEIVSLAHDVDTVRHLHLMTCTVEEKQQIIAEISRHKESYQPSSLRLYSIFIDSLARHTSAL